VSEVVEGSTLAVAGALLVFGLTLVFILRNRGGPELAFARLLADSRRRTIFLAALYTSLASLFGIGLASGVGILVGATGVEMNVVQTLLFGIGAMGIFVLMFDALHTSPLTLEEGWNLKETAARVSTTPAPLPPPVAMGPAYYSNERPPHRPGT
jgi:hypothetical protein